MGSFVGGMLEGLRSAYCSYLAGMPDWQKNWRRVSAVPGLKDYNDFMVGVMCDRPPEPTDYPPPPFTGGQCPEKYAVSFVGSGPSGAAHGVCLGTTVTLTGGTGVWGPIGGIRLSSTVRCSGDGGTAYDGIDILCHGRSYATRSSTQHWVNNVQGGSWFNASISNVVRVDGQPDECGDPEFDPGDYSPTNINIDLDVNYGPTNNFNVTIPVVIAPVYIAFDGTVNVPVTFDISPEISLEGTWTLFPDAKLELNFPTSPTEEPPGSTGDDDPPPDDPGKDDPDGGSEDDPDAPGKPDPEEPEEPEERIHFLIVRAVVNSEARPSTISQNVAPSLYVPRLGSARFGATVDGVTFWTSDIDIKGLNSIIECPIPWGATRFAVDAAPGVALNYAPVSTDPQVWPQYLQIGATYTDDRR